MKNQKNIYSNKYLRIIFIFLTLIISSCSTMTETTENDFTVLSSEDVVQAFITANLEVGEYRPMTKDDYGAAPYVAIEGTKFFIPSLCDDCGGRILSFESLEKLNLVKDYYISLGESSAIFFSWVFEHKNILVQINGDLPEEQARMYEQALYNLSN